MNRHSEALEFGERSTRLCRDLLKLTRVLCKNQIKELEARKHLPEESSQRIKSERNSSRNVVPEGKESQERESYNAVGKTKSSFAPGQGHKKGSRSSTGSKRRRTSSAISMRSSQQKLPLGEKRSRGRSNSQGASSHDNRADSCASSTSICIRAASEDGESL